MEKCEKCKARLNMKEESLKRKKVFYVDEETKEGNVVLCYKCYTVLEKRIENLQSFFRNPLEKRTVEIVVKKFLGEL